MAPPFFVQRQQSLIDGLVYRARFRTIVKEVEFRDAAALLTRLALQQNLADQRGDGLDGVGHWRDSPRRQAGIHQALMNALTDRPNLGLAR